MSNKTFTCNICGKEGITKPKSFAHNGGRACRKHKEAQESHNESERERKKSLRIGGGFPPEKKSFASKAEERRYNMNKGRKPEKCFQAFVPPTEEEISKCHNSCWICEKDGIDVRLVYERMLVNMNRPGMKDNFNFLDFFTGKGPVHDKTRKDLGIAEDSDKVIIRRFYDLELLPAQKFEIKKKEYKQLYDFAKYSVFCAGCCEKFRIKFVPDMPRDIDLSNLSVLGKLSEEIFGAVAEAEIMMEN